MERLERVQREANARSRIRETYPQDGVKMRSRKTGATSDMKEAVKVAW